VFSIRHQDWVIKIAYNSGQGNGDIIWRLGKDGDFGVRSSDAAPWFSHQHDAGFLPGDNTTIAVFDNGNTRRSTDSTAHSRGQVFQLDEQNRIASPVLSVDLGVYSSALGSAQKLANGNYHFNAGIIQGTTNYSQSIEVTPSGQVVYAIQPSTPNYRTFRLRDLYAMPAAITTSAASLQAGHVAPESIAATLGLGLAASIQAADLNLPTSLAGTAVNLRDSDGTERAAPLFFISPGQINYVVPSGTALGLATVNVVNGTQVVATGSVQISQVAPGLFAANAGGSGVAAGVAVTIRADGSQGSQSIFTSGPIGSRTSVPIDLGGPDDQVNLMLLGTGFRGAATLASFSAKIGDQDAQVLAAAPDSTIPGLDLVNIRVPRNLAGHGQSDVVLTVDGVTSNTVTVNIK